MEIDKQIEPNSRVTCSDLSGTTFHNVKMRQAAFENCDLSGTTFNFVNFDRCRLSSIGAGPDPDYEGPILSHVDLKHSILDHVVFTGARFKECDFAGATIDGVPFEDIINAYKDSSQQPPERDK